MRAAILEQAGGHEIYKPRHECYQTEEVPFRVSPTPLLLENQEIQRIQECCSLIAAFFRGCRDLFEQDESLQSLLLRDKPSDFDPKQPDKRLFIRPDLILTDTGPVVCEIETSLFGLGLSNILNTSYAEAGHNTLVAPNALTRHAEEKLPSSGTIVFSPKGESYEGQLGYLAEKVFGHGDNRKWHAAPAGPHIDITNPMYRAFYANEWGEEPMKKIPKGEPTTPSSTPWFEEKALMALAWDETYQEFFQKTLGATELTALRNYIPRTWILGEEKESIVPQLHHTPWKELPQLSAKNRNFILKASGFAPNSSWSEGVVFLGKKSRSAAQELLTKAAASNHLYVVQEFKSARKIPTQFESHGVKSHMDAKYRVTPYVDPETGTILSIKATGCENTDFIHGASNSVNTAVGRL